MNTDTFRIAINYQHKGKQPAGTAEEIKAFFRTFNGQFQNVAVTAPQWLAAVHQGHAFTTCHHRYRDAANFVEANHIALDFDTKDYRSSFAYLLRDPFIYCFASFLYTTPSHRPDAPKCRVCFTLDRTIRDRDKYTLLAQSLLHRYGRPRKKDKAEEKAYRAADRSCRDACRLFFGSEGCEVEYLGNVLSLDVAKTELVMPFMDWQKRQEEEAIERAKGVVVAAPGDISGDLLRVKLDRLLQNVTAAPQGEQHDTLRDISRTVGGYVASGYYGESEAIAALQAAIRANPQRQDMTRADEVIVEAVAYGRQSPLLFEKRLGD